MMKKTFFFCSMVAMTLSGCGNNNVDKSQTTDTVVLNSDTIKSAQQAAEDTVVADDAVTEDTVVELRTSDLAIFDLQGPVRKMTRPDGGIDQDFYFTKEGKIIKKGYGRTTELERNAQGQITLAYFEPIGDIAWVTQPTYNEDNTVCTELVYVEEATEEITYFYQDGLMVKKIVLQTAPDIWEGKSTTTTTYTYPNGVDAHGNWTKRIAKDVCVVVDEPGAKPSKSKHTSKETRKIYYY